MHPGSPPPTAPDAVAVEAATPPPAGRGDALVRALVDQLAAGQVETLHSFHRVAADLRRRADQLESAAREVPQTLAPQLGALISDVAGEVQDQMAVSAGQAVEALTAATRELTALAEAVVGAATKVSEDVVDRLVALLDERDRRDAALEGRLNARVERLTKRTETTINRLIGELADEVDLLRLRDTEDRASAAGQLQDLLDQLLAMPRGKLKALRTAVLEAQEENHA